ncbi:MAG TPA: DegT/DnrJ/EryC1/StrS family aminotransferase [Pyrinomonadaceae bacterium]|nr:DegT/DnrJ/EryC1/StrS family aminotransferase [Pyrinomonadaceae bacterium]
MSKPYAPKTTQIHNPQPANLTVPFVDLKQQYAAIKTEVDAAIARVIENTSFILGPEVRAFEASFAEYVGARSCIGVNSGTAALQLALMAAGIGFGDEVIVPSFTFFATAEAVSVLGATPVFIDIDPVSYTITAEAIERAITSRTRAIIPVHLYGQSADLDPIIELAAKHNLHVIEDAAQAHGAEYRSKRVGALGSAGCFSFYPSKNLGAYGEAGAIVTNDEELATRLRLLRDHGSTSKYAHAIVGYNFRMEEIQAAVLNVKLPHLNKWNDARRANAARYHEVLTNSELILPREMDYARHVYHVYAVQSDQRDELQRRLTAAGVQSGVHYPIPIHLQPAYASLGYQRGSLPVTEQLAERVLSLPMFPELTEEQINRVSDAVAEN